MKFPVFVDPDKENWRSNNEKKRPRRPLEEPGGRVDHGRCGSTRSLLGGGAGPAGSVQGECGHDASWVPRGGPGT